VNPPILVVDDLAVGFTTRAGADARVLDGISIDLAQGEVLGLAGESGCGKSTLLYAMMGFLKPGLRLIGGAARYHGRALFSMSEADLDAVRGGTIALVPQNAGQSLTPTIRVGEQIGESLDLHTSLVGPARHERILGLIADVRLPDPAVIARRYPHELSGGQQQRIAVAMALAGDPDVLLLDEPTTGLDVTTQLHILDLLRDLRAAKGMAMVCVSHDLGVIAHLADRVAIMYAGAIVEARGVDAVLARPAHPYTQGLLASIPRLGTGRIPAAIPGRPPAPGTDRPGCRYAERCPRADERCTRLPPVLEPLPGEPEGRAACHHAEPRGLDAWPGDAVSGAVKDGAIVLDIRDLAVSYGKRGLLGGPMPAKAVDGVTVSLRRGEVLGLVGESGSGKSTILRAITGLWPASGGAIVFDGAIVLDRPAARRERDVLRRVQLVFQNPDASLNPRHTIAEILAQPLGLYFGLGGVAAEARAADLLRSVRLDATYLRRYPGQLSGGEKQRVAIARAFAAEPDLILCDEVTSALDVSVQASVLGLLRDLTVERGVACILVSHDLAVVRALADRIVVLHRGRIAEIGTAADICDRPSQTYTRALVAAVLEPEPGARGLRAHV